MTKTTPQVLSCGDFLMRESTVGSTIATCKTKKYGGTRKCILMSPYGCLLCVFDALYEQRVFRVGGDEEAVSRRDRERFDGGAVHEAATLKLL